MDKIKTIFSGNVEQNEETGIVDELWKNSSLSWSTRVKGFALMFLLGIILSVLASVMFWIFGDLIVFAILYTLGNVCSISSTLFLMGPMSQLKKMFQTTRLIATIVMLISLVLTIVFAIIKVPELVLLFVVIQFFALLWYSLSYIPFARDAVKKIFTSIIA